MKTPTKPVLNIGKISDGRYKFSFSTDESTLFCEVSVAKSSDGSISDEQKEKQAVDKLKRLIEELDRIIRDLD